MTPQIVQKIVPIPLDHLDPAPWNPRTAADPGGLTDLADSIRAHGVLVPLLVRSASAEEVGLAENSGRRFQIVAGHRRSLAATAAGLSVVPCVVRELDDAAAKTEAIVDNLQRENLTPLDEARAFRRLLVPGVGQVVGHLQTASESRRGRAQLGHHVLGHRQGDCNASARPDILLPKMRRPKAFDLFCGAGGLSEGLRLAGFRVAGALDNDSLAISTYRSNHVDVRVWSGDIRKITARAVLKGLRLKRGSLPLLAGCPPCQAFSTLRTLNGRKRVRNKNDKDLLFEFLRFVRVLLPKTVWLENVPGLAKDQRLNRFRTALKRLGYSVEHKVLNAADYGVPQRRRRLILVGNRMSEIKFAPKAKQIVTVAQAIRDLRRPGQTRDQLHVNIDASRSTRIKDLIRQIPKDGGSRADVEDFVSLKCHLKCDGFRDVYGRMSWDSVSPTITSGCINPSKGRFLHPTQNRTITLREAALLQSFRKRYKFSLERGRYAVARMIGNALPPELVRRQASALYRAVVAGRTAQGTARAWVDGRKGRE
jgi:DNA (cytosine-5)-methyltransferase 1